MKSGRGTKLTGAVGEFLVAAELCRRNLVATPFAGNVPYYDIVGSGEFGGHVAIQVKTATQQSWVFSITKFATIERDGKRQIIGRIHDEPYPEIRYVMVKLGDGSDLDRFFILTWHQLANAVVDSYRDYLNKHHGIRPKKPDSMRCALCIQAIEHFEDQWDSIMRLIPNGSG